MAGLPADKAATGRDIICRVDHPPAWQLRFTTPQVGFPAWSRDDPSRLAFLSNESVLVASLGDDLATGNSRRVSDEPVGVETLLVAPDGRIVWWSDDTGDERGRWVVAPFDGNGTEALVPEIAKGWAAGISFAALRSSSVS